MKVRLYDKFEDDFTCAIYDGVKYFDNGTIYFFDGDEIDFDNQFVGVEILDT